MKNSQKQLTELQVIKSLRNARDFFEAQPKMVYSSKKNPFTDTDTGFVFNTTDDLLISLHEIGIQGKTIKEAGLELEEVYELLSQTQETITEFPKYSDPTLTKTTINKDESAQLIEEAEKIEKQQAEIREKSKQEVKQGIETKQRIYDLEQQREKDKQNEELLKQFFKGKKVVVVPTEEIPSIERPLTTKEKEVLFNATVLAHENPALLQKEIEKKIVQSINNSPDTDYLNIIPELIVSKTSINLTEQLQSMSFKSITDIPDKPKMFNQTSIFIPFTNPNDPALIKVIPDKATREKFTEEMQLLVTAKESERIVNTAGTNAVYGESIAYSIYGSEYTTNFQINENNEEKDNGLEVDLQEVYERANKAVELFKRIRSVRNAEQVVETGLAYYPTYTQTGNITKPASSVITKAIPATVGVYTFSKSVVLSQWVRSGTPLLSAGNQQLVKLIASQAGVQEIASASMVTFSKPIGFQLGRFSIAFTTGTNQSLGTQIAVGGVKFGEKMAGAIAVKGGTQVAIVTGTQAGGQLAVGASTALTKVLTFIGGLSSWATAGLSLIGGYVVGKVIEAGVSKFKVWWTKNKETIAPFLAVGAGLSLARFGMGPAILGGAGTFLMFGGTASALLLGPLRFFAILGRNIGITIATPVIVTLLILPPLVAFIMLIINNSAYVVPPAPPSSESGLGSEGLPGAACTEEKLPTSITFSVDSPIATRAWEIVEDLYQGFWCYWNRSPGDLETDITTYPDSYPELFDMDEFRRDPNPTRGAASTCAECMFWCTWLVQKSYKENGYNLAYTLWSPAMYDDFSSRNKILNGKDMNKDKIQMGAVIFFDVKNSENRIDHVAVVYSITSAGIHFVQSNSGTKNDFLPFGTDGVLQSPSYATIKGIGNP